MGSTLMVGTPLEGEHLHPYTLGTVSEDKCHGKKQIHTRAKDPDCTGTSQNPHLRLTISEKAGLVPNCLQYLTTRTRKTI